MDADDKGRGQSGEEDCCENSQLQNSFGPLAWWARTGDVHQDFLYLYKTGLFSDCTLQVPAHADESVHQIFRLHKVILATCSSAFQIQFFGPNGETQRKEAGNDELIVDSTSPEALDSAMLYIYGREKNFRNVELAIEVYLFAHEWQIENLMHAVNQFLLEKVAPVNVCQVYQMFKLVENKNGSRECIKMITLKTSSVLLSLSWLRVSLSTVLDILNQEHLHVKESVLLEAIIRWGRLQPCSSNGDVPNAELRETIDKPLKLIRFLSFSSKDFADLCVSNLKDLLTLEEILAISNAIALSNADYLPVGFCTKNIPRDSYHRFLVLDIVSRHHVQGAVSADESVVFSVNKEAVIIGLKFEHFLNDNSLLEAVFLLKDKKGNVMTQGNARNFDNRIKCFKFNEPVLLEANTRFQVAVSYGHFWKPRYASQLARSVSVNTLSACGPSKISVDLFATYSTSGIKMLVFANC